MNKFDWFKASNTILGIEVSPSTRKLPPFKLFKFNGKEYIELTRTIETPIQSLTRDN
jgi:hypothetical protein